MIHLISFATPNYYFSQFKLYRSAKKFGIDNITPYTHRTFKKTQFYKDNHLITFQSRGAGYWLWKPYYIMQHLSTLPEGDILIYCDSGVILEASLEPLFQIVNDSTHGILLFENYQGSAYYSQITDFKVDYNGLYVEPNKNKYWCKADIFDAIDAGSNLLYDSPQIDANIMIFRKTEASILFVKQWLEYCKSPQLLTDLPPLIKDSKLNCFFGHLHDQSIISVLGAKWGLTLYRAPTQFGNHFKMPPFRASNEYLLLPYSPYPKVNSPYGSLFLHTRFRTIPFLMRVQTFVIFEVKLLYSNIILFFFRALRKSNMIKHK